MHGVLHYVVREEHDRACNRLERRVGWAKTGGNGQKEQLEPADPAPDQLDLLIENENQQIVLDSFSMLGREHQIVLKMRADGLRYSEIAIRLGVNKNTVATWISRGIQELARLVRRRILQANAGLQGESHA